jgi:hypothetical protein
LFSRIALVVFFSNLNYLKDGLVLMRRELDAGPLLMYSLPQSYPRMRIILMIRKPSNLPLPVVTAPHNKVARVD